MVSQMVAGCHVLSLSWVQRARRGALGRPLSAGAGAGSTQVGALHRAAQVNLGGGPACPGVLSAHALGGGTKGTPGWVSVAATGWRTQNPGRVAKALPVGPVDPGPSTPTPFWLQQTQTKECKLVLGCRASAELLRYNLWLAPGPSAVSPTWRAEARPLAPPQVPGGLAAGSEAPFPRQSGGRASLGLWMGRGRGREALWGLPAGSRGRGGRQAGGDWSLRAIIQPLPRGPSLQPAE